MFEKFIAQYGAKELGLLMENEPLANHTTMRVGGPAKILVQPTSKENLIETVKLARELSIPFKVLGKGSNLLPSDKVYEGIVIKTEKALNYTKIEGTVLTAGAGVSDVTLARQTAKLGLSGLEFMSGIPGTIGGAVFMNAGAYLKEIKDVLLKAQILDEDGRVLELTVEELELSYRHSILHRQPGWIVLEATLQLEAGDKDEIMGVIRNRKEKRMIAQPLEMASAGSTFRNPEGHQAWHLVSESGLRGYRVGGAMVSEKHTNFVINAGDAKASDVDAVISHVQATVGQQFNVDMHREIEYFNWD